MLSKKLVWNNYNGRKLVVAIAIVAAEMLLGLLCIPMGFRLLFFFFGSIISVVVILYPKIGAMGMLFFLPGVLYLNYNIGAATVTPARLLVIATFIGLILHITINRSRIKPAPIHAPLLGLLAIAIFSIVQSANVGAGLMRLTFLFSVCSMAFVLSQVLDNKKSLKIAVGTMLAASAILMSLVLMEAYFGYRTIPTTATGGYRLMGPEIGTLYGTSHALALDSNTYLPFVLLLATGSAWTSFFLIILASCLIFSIVLSAAMAGWLATIGSLTVLVIVGFARKQHKAVTGALKRLLVVMALGSILAAATVPSGLMSYRLKRFLSILTEIHIYTERTEQVRIPVWKAAKRMFYAHPILGVGLGSMPIEYDEYMVAKVGAPTKEFVHHGFNVFADIGAEMGILGIGVFIWFIVAYTRHVLKYLVLIKDPFLGNMLLATACACVAVFIQMQTETGPFWANNFWCLLGLSLAIINVAKANQSETKS
jgi:O-antigen ligase